MENNNLITVVTERHTIECYQRNILMTTFFSKSLPDGSIAFENTSLDMFKESPTGAIALRIVRAYATDTLTDSCQDKNMIIEYIFDSFNNILSIELGENYQDRVLTNIHCDMHRPADAFPPRLMNYNDFTVYANLYHNNPVVREYIDIYSNYVERDLGSMSAVYGGYLKAISNYMTGYNIVAGRGSDGRIELVYSFPKNNEYVTQSIAAISHFTKNMLS